VTHDQVEAMSMADHIVLMDNGIIQQQGAPDVIYNDPNNVFTAQFIGTPPMNILPLENQGLRFGFRPEKVHMSYETATTDYHQKGVILTREMLGSETIYKVALDSETVMVKSVDSSFSMDENIIISVEQKNLLLFDKDGNRIRNLDSADYQKYFQWVGGTCNA
jgi:sn-glycerol 3-phosphate transport system ATP-binding protein